MTDTTADLDEQLAELTPLQERFTLLFLDCGSATEAYRRAGGKATTPESAWVGAHQLLRNTKVAAAIAALRAERSKALIADHLWVREQLVKIVAMATQAVPVLDSAGEPTGVYRCDLAAANAALRTLTALNAADPPPADDPGTREEDYARLRMMGLDLHKYKALPRGN
jgi:hypothetical protein